MKKIKTKVLLWGLLAATIPSVVLPVVACSTNVSKNNKSYSFDGQTFNSEEELNKYAHNNLSQQTSTTVANNQFWTLNTNGETTKYSDPYLLKNNIEKNIEPIAAQSSLNNKDVVNNSLGVNGEIPDQIVSRVIQSKQDAKLITVYRGRNNSYFTSEAEAKKSYLNNHEGYYFNDLYFSNIEGLKQYIDRNYDTIFTNNPNNKQFKVLQSPNGNVSQPIDPSNQEQAKQQVKEFVKNNYKPVYSIQKENTISYVSDTSPTELAKNLTLNDIDPVFLGRNGQGSYIVDTSKDDGANFYGPYFYNGNADVLKITDKSLWKEVGASDRDVLENNRENLLLQTFFALLINENENIDNDNRTLFEIDSLKEDTKIFNQYMEDNVPNLWEKVLAIKSNFAKGKRYNSLIKIPILYTCIFEELVYNGYPNEILTKVKQYFIKICELYDKSIRTIFPKEIITPELSSDLDVIDKNDGLLSFKSLFGFNSQTFDYSVDINYYFDKLKLNFKNIFKATQIATYAFQNGYKYDGVIPYDRDSLSELLGEKLDASYDTSWKYIWEILSCNDENTILNFYNKNKTNINIAYDEFYSILGHVVAKTKLFKECLKQDFNDAMEEYKSGKPLSSIKLFAGYNSDKLLRKIGNSFTLFCFFRFVPLINDTNQQHMFSGYEINTRFASLMYDSNQQHSNDTNDYPPFSLGRFAQLNNLFNSLETVVDESSEARNIEKIKKYFSDNKDNQIYLVFMKELLGKFDQGFSTTIFKQAIKLTQQIVNLAKGLAEAIKAVKNVASILKAIPALTVACFIVDIVSFLVDALTPNYEQKSYIYRSGNYEFIWDGGYKQTILYGWVTTGERTIDSMKILNPIKVTNPRTKDFYYLNGKNYETTQTQQLIEEYVRLLSIGRIDSDKIKINYTLNNYSNLNVNVKPVDVFDNIDDLANYVYDYVFTQNKQDKFLADYQMYKFTSGNINTTIPTTSNKQDAINKVTSLIKPTYIAMLPKVDQYNYPLTNNDSITNDNSITEYMLPGNSYDFKSGTIIPESSKPVDNKYVIVEPNLELSSNSSNSSLENNVNNPRKELETQFFNSFNVDSKIVFETDTIGVNKFTDLDYQPNNYLIYKASSPYGEVKYFLDKEKAFSWLMSKANINYIENKKEGYSNKKEMYNTLFAFLDWDTLNFSSVNGQPTISILKNPNWFNEPWAEQAFNVKIGNNPSFNALYAGKNDIGGTWGVDFRLLEHGTEDENKQYNIGDVRYNLDFTFNSNFWKTFINDVKNYLCDANIIKSVFVKSFPTDYNGIDPNQFFDNFVNVNDYKNFIDKLLENNSDWFSFMNVKDSVDNKSKRANGFDINEKYTDVGNWSNKSDAVHQELDRQKECLSNALEHLNIDISKIIESDDALNVDIASNIKLIEFLETTFGYYFANQNVEKEKIELTIDYNNQPIFSLTNDFIELVNEDSPNDKSYLRQRIINHLDKNRNKNYLINVSNKFSNLNGLYTNKNSNSNLISVDAINEPTIDEFINDYKNLINFYTIENFKDELINKTSLLIDSQNPLSSNLGIILALYSYHKRITDPKFNSSQASKNLLKDSSNILVLKKDNGSLLDIKYGEIVGTSTSINEPLSNDKKNKISINQQELNQYITLNTSLTPAKVIVIYDLDNNIVNSDFSIDGNGYGDGSYDSEQTIIDNALNTLIFNQDAEYVYYVDNNQETLVKNSVNQIYSLSLNDKIYYYPTFKDARNELKEYINLNAKHFN